MWNTTGGLDPRALPIPVLRDAWTSVVQTPPTTWVHVADPMGAAMLSGQRLGWTMTHPFEWRTDEGITLLLGQDAPALVEWHVGQSAQRLVESIVAEKCATEELVGRRADLGFIRRLLQSKAASAMSDQDKCALRVVSANGMWPRQRQADAGYPVDPTCEKCDAGVPDTVHHRAWCCQWSEAETRRREIASADLIREAQEQPESVMFTRGIRPHPADREVIVAPQQQTLFWRNGEQVLDKEDWKMSGNIFYDGSCFKHRDPELSTASFSVVEVDEYGESTAVLRATVSPELPQTSQAAEHSGRLAAVQLLCGTAVLHGDCKAVVDSAKLPGRAACHHKRLHGGSRRAADASQHSHWATDVKVKAHRKLESAQTDEERWEIRGNAAADSNAVAAQLLHPLLSAEQRARRQDEDNKLEKVCRVLGAVPRLWPSGASPTNPRGAGSSGAAGWP